MTVKRGTIFNIQKFSIHDGLGIRTLIFMKGCPLKCLWCSNPESQKNDVEIMDIKVNCVSCGKCVDLCEANAIDKEMFDIDRNKCNKCGMCAENCFANAKKKIGEIKTVSELMTVINKDMIFCRNSGGGVTIGGGEPLMQYEFVEDLLKECKSVNINTAIETCGYGDWSKIKGIFQYTDQVFFDIKAFNSQLHKKLTGVNNDLILENARKIVELSNVKGDFQTDSIIKKIVFRIPLIPGCNDTKENIKSTGDFVASFKDNKNIYIEILPYHNLGEDKYKWLNKEYKLKGVLKHSSLEIDKFNEILRLSGCNVVEAEKK